jgi:hypothetical protein
MKERDLTDFFAQRDADRLRAAGFVPAAGLSRGEQVWRLPGGSGLMAESEALKWLDREERRGGQGPA